mgnify:FL=1
MTYDEIINKNKDMLPSEYKWWATHAFHFTALDNAISILKSGVLYSRIKAEQNSLMHNENASRAVISMTDFEVLSYVRFYFRPLTPTQYHNEGYKHPQLRYDSQGANISIPVFFVFRLNSLLSDNKTAFSCKSKAGHNDEVLAGVEEFAGLNFEQIYASSYMTNSEEEKKYRQAEILYPDAYKIDDSLEVILCRSEVERNTLLKKLKEEDSKIYEKYKTLIKIGKRNVFQNNGFFVKSVSYCDGRLDIFFNDSINKIRYTDRQMRRNEVTELLPLQAEYIFEWKDSRGKQITMKHISQELSYSTSGVTAQPTTIPSAKVMSVEMYIDGELLFSNDFDLSESVIF